MFPETPPLHLLPGCPKAGVVLFVLSGCPESLNVLLVLTRCANKLAVRLLKGLEVPFI